MSPLKRLHRLKGKRKRLPALDSPRTPAVPQLEEEELDVWAKRLGSEAEARRMLKLREKYQLATLPELVTLDWLQRNGYLFEFQAPLFGGRRAGGTVLDFLVFDGGRALAWQVQGSYWHTLKTVSQRDKQILLRLLGAEVSGFHITGVVELWEDQIYSMRPLIYYQALAGINMR